ncbi:MAG: hypothetical protein R3A13_07005 [Bdellovibrionota bacterium]
MKSLIKINLLFGILCISLNAYALPFNDDMVDIQPRTGADHEAAS